MAKTKRQKAEMHRCLARRAVAKRGDVTLAPPPWDHGATGPANRIGLVVEERGEVNPATGKVTNPNRVTGVRRVDHLAFWHRRGTISTGGYNAAVALRDAYEATLTSAAPALPENDRVQASPKPDVAVTIRVHQISRYSRYMRLVHRDDVEIVSRCVLDGWHPSRVYGALRTKEGLAHLRDALDRLHAAMG